MILGMKPLNLAEVKELVKGTDEKKPIHEYIKKFGKLSKKEAGELAGKIMDLKNDKIKEENIVKLADFLPKTPEEVNKIFNEISLNEQETNAILEITKEY